MPRVLTEKQKTAMQKGRQQAAAAGRKAAVERVRDFRRWLAEDRDYRQAVREGLPTLPPKPKMPAAIPSDHDFAIAREEQ